MSEKQPKNTKLEIIRTVADLIHRHGLLRKTVELSMTRDYILLHEDFQGRLLMELDLIEKNAPESAPEVKKLRDLIVSLPQSKAPQAANHAAA